MNIGRPSRTDTSLSDNTKRFEGVHNRKSSMESAFLQSDQTKSGKIRFITNQKR